MAQSPSSNVGPLASGLETLNMRGVPWWAAVMIALGSAIVAAWGTQAWLQREGTAPPSAVGVPADEQALIDLAPTAAGTLPAHSSESSSAQPPAHAPTMLYGMLPLRSGQVVSEAQCRQRAADAMKEAGISEIDTGGESALFARQGDYAFFVGCHLDQKLVLVGAAGPVPEQAESLQEQLLRSLQTRF